MNETDLALPDEELRRLFSAPPKQRLVVGFYLDGNISQIVTDHLRDASIKFTDVYLDDRADEPSDFRLLARAATLGLVMVTQDRDFRELETRLHTLQGLRHAGIILVKSRTLKGDEGQLAQLLIRLTSKYEGWGYPWQNQILTV